MSLSTNSKLTREWWEELETQWKKAFNECFFNKGPVDHLPEEKELRELYETTVLRIVGPGAPHPNCSLQLTNLNGVQKLDNLEILVITHHQIRDVLPLKKLSQLKSVFLNNNNIRILEGMEKLREMTELYVQDTMVQSLDPISSLKKLRKLYCQATQIKQLNLPPKLKELYCLPNENIFDREIMRVEKEYGIRCRKG